jgi:simple sugar transport system permease protein
MTVTATNQKSGIAALTVRSVLPILLALIVAAIILLSFGVDPLQFYGSVVANSTSGRNWQYSLVLMAPLLIVAVSLIVAFRGSIWNLGYDGQYILAAVSVAGLAPRMMQTMAPGLVYLILTVTAIAIAVAWTLIPAWLKARYGTNEIITTVVMTTIGVGVANILIQKVFQDPTTTVTGTEVMAVADMLPYIPGTRIHMGLILALVVVIVFQFVTKRTSFGLRLDAFGANPKAARHAGIRGGRMTLIIFIVSGALIGLAGAIDILGNYGYARANWNPGYGIAILPFVFLARLSPLGSVPFVAFYAFFATGSRAASQEVGLSVDFIQVIVALILVFMAVTEYIGTKRELGQSYLPDELKDPLLRLQRQLRGKEATS